MKKLFLFTAMFALLAVSCQKGTDGPNDGRTQLTIKLGDGSGNTRSVESPGLTVGLTLTDGHIFVINNVGSVIYDVALDIAAAYGSSGQKLMDKTNTSDPLRVSSDSRVYVLGNIPASVNVASLSSWSQIEAATSRIVYDKTTPANSLNTDYTKAPVANESGQPENITVTGSQGSVAINLVPLYTRLEIAKITGTGNITAFRVAGVYIDKYYDTFTMTGGVPAAAVAWDLQQGTVFTDNIGDVAAGNEWQVAVTPGSSVNPTIDPGSGKLWAFHLPAVGIPGIIIHLTDIKYSEPKPGSPGETVEVSMPGDRYVTVTSFNSGATDLFKRGEMYRIADLAFTQTKIGPTPNPIDIDLTVKVDLLQWKVNPLFPDM